MNLKVLIIVILLVFALISVNSVDFRDLNFDTYDTYIQSPDKSIKWNTKIKEAYDLIENYNYENANKVFLSSLELGCKSKQIIKDNFLCYLKNDNFNWADKNKEVYDFLSKYASKELTDIAFKIIGDIFFEKGEENPSNYEIMIFYYEKANSKQEGIKIIADNYFEMLQYEKALNYYTLLNNTDKINECSKIINIIKSYKNTHFGIDEWDKALMLWKNPYALKKDDVYLFYNVSPESWIDDKMFYANCWRYQTTYYFYIDINDYNAADIIPSGIGSKCLLKFEGVVNNNFPKFKLLHWFND